MYFFSVTLTIFLSDSGRRNPPCAPPGLHLHDARDDAPGGIPVQAELHTTLRLLHTWVTIGSATWNWAGPRLTLLYDQLPMAELEFYK